MDKYINILNRIFPFSYLEKEEKIELIRHAKYTIYPKKFVLCKAGSTKKLNYLFLLLKGSVSVILDNVTIGHIEAPAYFGERAVFFQQPRKATIMADKGVECLIVDSQCIKNLINSNFNFCYAFASSFRNKHNLFDNYDHFVNLLKQRKMVHIEQLLPDYKRLSPVLHKYCTQEKIDYYVLSYVVSRLPEQLSSLSQLILALDLPTQYKKIQNIIKIETPAKVKRNFYELLPGRIFAALRDEHTDYIDIVTKLCAYTIESKKIVARLIKKPSAIQLLANYYYGSAKDKELIDRKTTELPFTVSELARLRSIYKNNLLNRLYEMVSQNGNIQVQFIASDIRYYSDITELWIEQISNLLNKHFSNYLIDEGIDIHIISSNTHSVLNCLSPWVHKHASAIVDRDEFSELENTTDRLYAAVQKLLATNPEMIKDRRKIEKRYGIFRLDNPGLTSITVSVIDLGKLSRHIDPYLRQFYSKKKSILFNIDYAFGKQAEPIIRNLILLFGKKIKSLSILGKAGSIVGERGELMLPNRFIIQENDVVYPITTVDLNEQDFRDLGWQRKVHCGPMLTVLGTLMQNSEMLWFYRHFWKAIGVEMEWGYFLQEISRAKIQNLIDPNIILRFAYYISDTPLNEGKTLACKLTLQEGLPAVYSITRIILKKIIM